MKFITTLLTLNVFILIIGEKEFLHAATTEVSQGPVSASTSQITSTITVSVTTLKPKINIKDSELCKKCSCDMTYLQIDCSNKSMTSFFSDDEWKTLENGDVMFEIIKMDHNQITYIPEIPNYPVKSLYLSFNKIFNISIGAFQNLSDLKNLDLSHNQLSSKSLVPHVFKGMYAPSGYLPMPNLKSLNLGHNEMHTLNSDIFEHLPNLETLILKKNPFQIIDTCSTTAISSLGSLKTLDMSNMELSELPEGIFHGPRELTNLILTGNLFHKLPAALSRCLHLKKLILDENPLDDLENANVFKSLGELEYLSISYLPDITKIGPYAFSDLQNLTTLIAVDNVHLEQIHKLAFTKNTSNPDLYDYPPLEKLHLRNNNLTTIERNWIVRWDKVTDIDLGFNPWTCDCTNSWLIHSLIKQIHNTTPALTDRVVCATSLGWKNKKILELSDNRKELICENASNTAGDSLIMLGILVGVLIGIPLSLGGLIIYKRGCFGLLYRKNPADRTLYNRANFADDFHI